MNIEFTKQLSVKDWNDIRIALTENKSNLKDLTTEQDKVIKKFINEPYRFGTGKDFLNEWRMLSEMAGLTKKMWSPGKTLKVFFFGGENDRKRKIIELASEWSNYCSIKFSATTNQCESDLRIAFNPNYSCSVLGTDAILTPQNEYTINFGWLTASVNSEEDKRVILHEFGHALGLIHEHQSPAIKVNWNKNRVYHYFDVNHKWDKGEVDRNIFEEFETTKTKFSKVDVLSIMTYNIPSDWTNDGISFPINYVLSDLDKEYIGKIYS
ncbi:hypothetical protein AGMMS4957_12890 [Bacteroidia bacterium]|nr:hypothetical protein AGMMS4957_12890 [Bacteroidia bacterium]